MLAGTRPSRGEKRDELDGRASWDAASHLEAGQPALPLRTVDPPRRLATALRYLRRKNLGKRSKGTPVAEDRPERGA